jgi:flagellar hook-associated protein 1 FlgK
VATSLTETRKGIDSKVTGIVSEVNALAKQMAELNKQVRSQSANGASPNDLLDARQRVQDRLVELTGAKPVENGDGSVNLKLPQGPTLVYGPEAGQLSTVADVNNNGHLTLRYVPADGSAPTALNSDAGGELGGLLAARDGALKTALNSLDTLAFDLSNAMNSVHSAGYALDGSTGRELFTVGSSSSGAATAMQVNSALVADPSLLAAASSAANVPGDASQLQLLIATESQALSTGADATNALSSIITDFGLSAQRIASIAEHDEATSSNILGMRDSVSGVSIEEEMVNLTRAQRAYEAVSKVIQTTNEMLDTLMQLK